MRALAIIRNRRPFFGETFHQDGVFTREGGEPWTAYSC